MAGKKFYITVVEVRILHDRPLSLESLSEIAEEITDGGSSGDIDFVAENVEISELEMHAECVRQGTEPAFFGIGEPDEAGRF